MDGQVDELKMAELRLAHEKARAAYFETLDLENWEEASPEALMKAWDAYHRLRDVELNGRLER